MAVSNQEVAAWLAANPAATDAEITQAAAAAGVSPAQLAEVTGLSEGEVISRVVQTLAPNQNIDLGGTFIQPVYDEQGSGENWTQGAMREIFVYDVNQTSKGDPLKQYSPTGELIANNQFQGGGNNGWSLIKELSKELAPIALAALTGGGAGGLLGGALAPTASAAAQGAIGGALIGGGGAALTGNDVLKGALLGGAGGYLQGANNVASGFGPQTDASFLAADAAQLANAGLSEAQIAQVLGASGYASGPAASLAASMAVNGLDVNMMTQQLDALSTNTGLMSQTGSAADFAAADALQLRDQVGNNFAAIEQNLIASGVDPLIAADISQQIAFNPNLTQADLATNLANSFGNNIYDVDMAATYPTSVLPGAGGLLSDLTGAGVAAGAAAGVGTTASTAAGVPAGATAGTTAGTVAGLTPAQIASLAKAGISLAGLTGATKAISGQTGGSTSRPMQAPTQGVPVNDPNYYNQLQQYYNAYLPQTPRDVVTPLQQWYNAKSGA